MRLNPHLYLYRCIYLLLLSLTTACGQPNPGDPLPPSDTGSHSQTSVALSVTPSPFHTPTLVASATPTPTSTITPPPTATLHPMDIRAHRRHDHSRVHRVDSHHAGVAAQLRNSDFL